MAVETWTDGTVVTGSGLNASIGNKMGLVAVSAGQPTTIGSVSAETKVLDYFIPSGTMMPDNRIAVNTNWWCNGSDSNGANVWIKIGPSGSAPTLTNIGSYASFGSNNTNGMIFPMWAAGSTTVDNSATPAMVRMSLLSASNKFGVSSYGVFSVYP